MSHVDEALRAWESGSGPARGEGERPRSDGGPRFELGGYAREGLPKGEVAAAFTADNPGVSLAGGESRPRRIDADLRARLVGMDLNSVSLEQYRRLAAVLHDVQQQQGLKTVMVTSALPEEGKTLTTANLALTLSESYGRRVLVIDADLRWPAIHRMFGIANDTGLSEVLQSEGVKAPIRQVTARLSALTAGRPGPTPLAGLTSQRMATLVSECASQFDWVLLDTPPVGLLPDAQPLARLTGAVLFVIAAGVTPQSEVERGIAELGTECILGTVLNRVDERKIPAAGYYYYSRYAERDSESQRG